MYVSLLHREEEPEQDDRAYMGRKDFLLRQRTLFDKFFEVGDRLLLLQSIYEFSNDCWLGDEGDIVYVKKVSTIEEQDRWPCLRNTPLVVAHPYRKSGEGFRVEAEFVTRLPYTLKYTK